MCGAAVFDLAILQKHSLHSVSLEADRKHCLSFTAAKTKVIVIVIYSKCEGGKFDILECGRLCYVSLFNHNQ